MFPLELPVPLRLLLLSVLLLSPALGALPPPATPGLSDSLDSCCAFASASKGATFVYASLGRSGNVSFEMALGILSALLLSPKKPSLAVEEVEVKVLVGCATDLVGVFSFQAATRFRTDARGERVRDGTVDVTEPAAGGRAVPEPVTADAVPEIDIVL